MSVIHEKFDPFPAKKVTIVHVHSRCFDVNTSIANAYQ